MTTIRNRKLFLSVAGASAFAVGCLAFLAPRVLLLDVKAAAEASGAAVVMARTTGVLLLAVGALSWAIRGDEDSPTMRSFLAANFALQIAIMPVDPWAFATGVWGTPAAFLPNTILHILLAAGFAWFRWGAGRGEGTVARA